VEPVHGGTAAGPGTRATTVAGRDEFLDLLRTVAILRVVVVHLAGAAGLLWWPAPTWVLPGMPVVFFVSGALAFGSLDPHRDHPTPAGAFRRNRLRRLLIPYWGFLATVVAAVMVSDVVTDGGRTAVRFDRLLDAPVPLAVPPLSPASGFAVGHLWFMGSFLVLIVLAPVLVRWYRSRPVLLVASTGAVFIGVQLLDAADLVPRELDRASLFALFFVLGFTYTDGRLDRVFRRVPPVVLVAGFALAAVAAFRIEPRVPNATEPLHGLLGAAWLTAALAARPVLGLVAVRARPVLSVLTRRTLTIYLWGWPTTQLAHRIVDPTAGGSALVTFLALAVGLLVLAVVVAGPLEDVAAGRPARLRG
jgi:peptidoglycan/LPS O-acetylase OafA/YrhL